MDNLVINIILEIILIAIALYIAFFKGYSNEKGKNLATKQDITEITKKIETVKNDLTFYSQRKLDWFIENKKNIIDFYDNYFVWVDISMNTSDILISYHDNSEKLRDAITYLKTMHQKVVKYLWRMQIYDNDFDFNKTLAKIYIDAAKKHNTVLNLLLTLEDITIEHKNLIEKNSENSEALKKYEELKKEKNEAFETYYREKDSLEKLIKENKRILVNTIKKKLENNYAPLNE